MKLRLPIALLAAAALDAPTVAGACPLHRPHSVNTSQRCVPLDFEQVTAAKLEATVPDNPNLAPPGSYLLFLVDADGVPSGARHVHVKAESR